jgi:hypothetical protein
VVRWVVRLQSRLRKLEDSLPRCGGGVHRLAGPDYVPTEADRCTRCGGCHVLVIEEVVVERVGDEVVAVPRREGRTP